MRLNLAGVTRCAVFPSQGHGIRNLQLSGITYASRNIHTFRHARTAYLDADGGLAIFVVSRVGYGQRIGLGVLFNLYINIRRRITAGHPQERGAFRNVLGHQSDCGAEAGHRILETEVQVAENLNPYVGRIGVATIDQFHRAEDIVAATVVADGKLFATANRILEYQIFVPVDRTVFVRMGFERETGLFLTIDGIATDHDRCGRRIEGQQLNRITEHFATRFVANRHRIATVLKVEEVFRGGINRRYRYRIVERGIARGQNRDATVGQFARRRVFAQDIGNDRRTADEDKGLHRAALATVFFLIYVIDMVARRAIQRQGVAHMNRRTRAFGRIEPLEFGARLLAGRIQ